MNTFGCDKVSRNRVPSSYKESLGGWIYKLFSVPPIRVQRTVTYATGDQRADSHRGGKEPLIAKMLLAVDLLYE
jgi:hypothetical protein